MKKRWRSVSDVVRCPQCNSECWSEEGYETIYRCKQAFCGLSFTIEKKKE